MGTEEIPKHFDLKKTGFKFWFVVKFHKNDSFCDQVIRMGKRFIVKY